MKSLSVRELPSRLPDFAAATRFAASNSNNALLMPLFGEEECILRVLECEPSIRSKNIISSYNIVWL